MYYTTKSHITLYYVHIIHLSGIKPAGLIMVAVSEITVEYKLNSVKCMYYTHSLTFEIHLLFSYFFILNLYTLDDAGRIYWNIIVGNVLWKNLYWFKAVATNISNHLYYIRFHHKHTDIKNMNTIIYHSSNISKFPCVILLK